MDEPQSKELADVRGLAHLRHRRDAVPGRRELALEPGQPVLQQHDRLLAGDEVDHRHARRELVGAGGGVGQRVAEQVLELVLTGGGDLVGGAGRAFLGLRGADRLEQVRPSRATSARGRSSPAARWPTGPPTTTAARAAPRSRGPRPTSFTTPSTNIRVAVTPESLVEQRSSQGRSRVQHDVAAARAADQACFTQHAGVLADVAGTHVQPARQLAGREVAAASPVSRTPPRCPGPARPQPRPASGSRGTAPAASTRPACARRRTRGRST